ncbi:MAG: hypothetical protein Q6K99_02720 [Thermostichales cyanobacterium BF4_bins_65]
MAVLPISYQALQLPHQGMGMLGQIGLVVQFFRGQLLAELIHQTLQFLLGSAVMLQSCLDLAFLVSKFLAQLPKTALQSLNLLLHGAKGLLCLALQTHSQFPELLGQFLLLLTQSGSEGFCPLQQAFLASLGPLSQTLLPTVQAAF